MRAGHARKHGGTEKNSSEGERKVLAPEERAPNVSIKRVRA
jgi:hypothetical protein